MLPIWDDGSVRCCLVGELPCEGSILCAFRCAAGGLGAPGSRTQVVVELVDRGGWRREDANVSPDGLR